MVGRNKEQGSTASDSRSETGPRHSGAKEAAAKIHAAMADARSAPGPQPIVRLNELTDLLWQRANLGCAVQRCQIIPRALSQFRQIHTGLYPRKPGPPLAPHLGSWSRTLGTGIDICARY